LAVKNMGGETSQAWRAVLDDLIKRGLRKPQFLIVDGGTGLEQALATLWGDVPTQRCTVHKHRNLLRLSGATDARCLRLNARFVRRTRNHRGSAHAL
jgi:transposase-like protein